ncbi:hypothetical protein L226DRAFT_466805 [Lentinus tigrinus ALCF2SS1-7]|uniref:Uncharacterized protein n=1 Tax=Lentinus tigrinus ALCF2SS1-6 TaxID=1328759 RepID=A0A5C2RVJ3_9APHY|nr:hypothetical protein L227DRAFT_509913 [Lentinus tigrinus ALCF2SS1-6]RPD72613.1 hypothetical protein L226DRAFT_466805 [Lentinus tigrinus ALCF2SS1-7]
MSTAEPPTPIERAERLWRTAWGHPWPHRFRKVISIQDIFPDGDVPISTDDSDDDESRIPNEFKYTCLHGMKSVFEACGGSATPVQDVLVIRPEYVWLRETMQHGYLADADSIVITGQPGIGKTVFLLYLLLYRLERKLPTAIHLYGDAFVMFNNKGAEIGSARAQGTSITEDYWALTDSNAKLAQPCNAFITSDARVIQASPPKPDRWKAWCKHRSGKVVVSDLPRPLEIGAIVKELGLQTNEVYPLVSKWGPCIRSILSVLKPKVARKSSEEGRKSSEEDRESDARMARMSEEDARLRAKTARMSAEADLSRAAEDAAKAILAMPSAFLSPLQARTPDDVWSALLFVSPDRQRLPGTDLVFDSGGAFTHIPTPYLTEVFNAGRSTNNKLCSSFAGSLRMLSCNHSQPWT